MLLSKWTYPAGIAVGADGSAYVAGTETTFGGEGSFPATPGAFQTRVPEGRLPFPLGQAGTGPAAAFVARVSADGSSLIAATYLAGNYTDSATSVSLDGEGKVIVTGLTGSHDFLATGIWKNGCGPDRGTAFANYANFVTKLEPLLTSVTSSAVVKQFQITSVAPLGADGSFYAVGASINAAYYPGYVATRLLRVKPDAEAGPVTCVVNGASMLADEVIAPGQLLTVMGQGLGPDELIAFDSSQQLPVEAEGTEVRVGGVSAPLLAVVSGQINAVVPYSLPFARTTVEVRRHGAVIYAQELRAYGTNPEPLLRYGPAGKLDVAPDYPVPLADAVNQDGTLNSALNPAPPGSVVTIFASGYGRISPAPVDGAPGTAS